MIVAEGYFSIKAVRDLTFWQSWSQTWQGEDQRESMDGRVLICPTAVLPGVSPATEKPMK